MAAAAFPAFHVTGAVHHYVRWVGISVPIYLGTCESNPVVNFQELVKEVHNDVAGPSLPMDMIENGEMANIASGLNRFSKGTFFGMLAATANSRRSRWSRGLPTFGRTTIELWMVFENYFLANAQVFFPNLEIGWYFPQVKVQAKEIPRIGNGQDQLLVLHGEAHPKFQYQSDPTVVAQGDREWLLYSTDPTLFPAAVLVPQ